MRLNLFKYHVQDRDYSRAEIVHLLNNKSYIHMTLSDSTWNYSLGTIFDSAKWLATPVTYLLSSIGSYAWDLGKGFVSSTILGIANVKTPVIINNKYNYNYDSNFKLTDLDDYKYSGREVTKFLNEYYDCGIHWDSKVYYGKMIDKLLSHDFANAEVPTLDNSGWFDIAVLDTYKSLDNDAPIKTQTIGKNEYFDNNQSIDDPISTKIQIIGIYSDAIKTAHI